MDTHFGTITSRGAVVIIGHNQSTSYALTIPLFGCEKTTDSIAPPSSLALLVFPASDGSVVVTDLTRPHSHRHPGRSRVIYDRPQFCTWCQSCCSIYNRISYHFACFHPECSWSEPHKIGPCECVYRCHSTVNPDNLQVRTSAIPKSARRRDWLRPLWLLGMVLYILSQLIGSTLALDYMRAGTSASSLRLPPPDDYSQNMLLPLALHLSFSIFCLLDF